MLRCFVDMLYRSWKLVCTKAYQDKVLIKQSKKTWDQNAQCDIAPPSVITKLHPPCPNPPRPTDAASSLSSLGPKSQPPLSPKPGFLTK